MKTCEWASESHSLPGTSDTRYTSVRYGGIVYEVGSFILVRDEDVPDEKQDNPEFCYVAQISEFYEKDSTTVDKFRARVKWFSKLADLPKKFRSTSKDYPPVDDGCERIVDLFHSYGNDISVETVYKKCKVVEIDPFLDPRRAATAFHKKYDEPVFVLRFKFEGKPPQMIPIVGNGIRRRGLESESPSSRESWRKRSPATSLASPRILMLSPDDLKVGRRPSLSTIKEESDPKATNGKPPRTPLKGPGAPMKGGNKDFTPVKNIPKGMAKLRVRDGDLLGMLDSDESDSEQSTGFYPDGMKKTPLKKATFLTQQSSDTKVKFTRIRSSAEKLQVVSVDEADATPTKPISNAKSASEPSHNVKSYPPSARRVLRLEDKGAGDSSPRCDPPRAITPDEDVEPSVRQSGKTPKPSGRRGSVTNGSEEPSVVDTPVDRPRRRTKLQFEEKTPDVPARRGSEDSGAKTPVRKRVSAQKVEASPAKRSRSSAPAPDLETLEVVSVAEPEAKTPSKNQTPAKKSVQNEATTPSFHRRVVGTPRSSGRQKARRGSSRKVSQSSEESEEILVRTPRRKKSQPGTPASIPRRLKSSVATPHTLLEQARARLHVSAVPDSLPCRENEFADIYAFAEGKIQDGAGGCMYISGVPGTGKTATVHEVVNSLKRAREEGDLESFKFVEVNGMRVTTPHQVYVQILEGITGSRVTSAQALQMLDERFSKRNPKKETVLLLVDELDLLWTRKQDVLYNIFDWPSRTESKLIVLAVANTMDLPERVMMNRVSSRLGLVRLTFQPYNFKQLQEIVASRMLGLEAFDPDAVQLVARKVAAVSGDARRALDICRRATEIAELQPKETFLKSPSKSPAKKKSALVGLRHVDLAIQEMFTSPRIAAIRSCTQQEKIFLQAVTSEFQRTGIEEAVFQNLISHHRALCTFHGLKMPVTSDLLAICARLGALRLLITEHARADLFQRIRLNVNADDINYALNSEKSA